MTHHRDHRWATDQVSEVVVLDHLHRLLGGFLNVVLEHRHAEFLGHRLDRRHVQGLGDRGDDSFEEEGFDDLRALDTEHVGEFLNREVVLRNDQHLRPHLLGFAGGAKLHRPAALPLTGGFLLALPHRRHRLRCGSLMDLRLGGAGEARGEHHRLLFSGEATGFRGQGIIVLADDVHLLALFLRRTAAQGLQLGAVVPVGSTGSTLTGSCSGTESRTTGCRGRCRPRHRWGGLFAITGFGRGVWTPWRRCCRATIRLLELHELAGCHRLSHATRHPWTDGRCRSAGAAGAARTARGTAAVTADGLTDEFEGAATAACRRSGATGGSPRSGGTCWGTATGAARAAGPLGRSGSRSLGHGGPLAAGSWPATGCTAGLRFAHQFRAGGRPGGHARLGGGTGFGRCTGPRWSPRSAGAAGPRNDLRFLARSWRRSAGGGCGAWCGLGGSRFRRCRLRSCWIRRSRPGRSLGWFGRCRFGGGRASRCGWRGRSRWRCCCRRLGRLGGGHHLGLAHHLRARRCCRFGGGRTARSRSCRGGRCFRLGTDRVGAGLAGGAAFLTERIALPPEGFAAAADFVGAADFPDPAAPFFSRLRIFPASSSLIELLWLLAAIESFSAASSTSLFSRPRSLDSS